MPIGRPNRARRRPLGPAQPHIHWEKNTLAECDILCRRITSAVVLATVVLGGGLSGSSTVQGDDQIHGLACSSGPSAIRGLSVRAAGALVTVRWQPPAGANSASHFEMNVGSAPGQIDVFKRDLENVRSYATRAASGTYFVRMRATNPCGEGPWTDWQSVTVTNGVPLGQSALRVDPATVRIDTLFDKDAIVYGEVQNGWGAGGAEFIEVIGRFLGAGGRFLGSDSTYIQGPTLQDLGFTYTNTALRGGETGCFTLFTDVPRAQVRRIQWQFDADDEAIQPAPGRVVLQQMTRRSDFSGDLRMEGVVKNAGNTTTVFTEILANVKSAKGRVLDCHFTFIDGQRITLPGSGIQTNTALRPSRTGVLRHVHLSAVQRDVDGGTLVFVGPRRRGHGQSRDRRASTPTATGRAAASS